MMPLARLTRSRWTRWVAPLCLLAVLVLAVLPFGGRIRFNAAIVCLEVAIVWGVLARQWILVGIAVAPVVSVIGFIILASQASFFRHHRNHHGNEPAAVANLRTINTAEVTYLSNSGGAYGTIADLIDAGLLDDTFSGTKAGYNFSIMLDATGSGYTAEAAPAEVAESHAWSSSKPPANTRLYAYYSLPDAVVRYSTNASFAPAGQTGKSVQ